jgi:hypothetical protein
VSLLRSNSWEKRGAKEAYPDPPERGNSESDIKPVDGCPPSVVQGDEYLALEIVRYLNRYLDIIWNRITSLTLLILLLMAAVDSYPFRPEGALFRWMMGLVLLSVVVVVRVLIGINGNEFIARVNKVPVNRSLWNLDFLGKLTTYVAPVLGLLTVLSVGVSDFLRIVLGPFVH